MNAYRLRLIRLRLAGLGLLLGLALAGCGAPAPTAGPPATQVSAATPSPTASPAPPPDARAVAGAYLAAWQAGRYGEMHARLSAGGPAQSAADFEAQYRRLLDTMTAVTVTAEITAVSETGDSAQATAKVRYDTALVGVLETEIALPLVREAGEWRVVFSPALVWPELVDGRQLLMATIPTPRGNIYDRNGAPLVLEAHDAYALGVVPQELPPDDRTVPSAVGRLLETAPSLVAARYASAVPDQYFPLAEASAAEMSGALGALLNYPGVYATPYNDRFYFGNGAAAAVTGYTTFIQPEELVAFRARGYTGAERVGRVGLEAWAERALAGRPGGQLQLRDAANTFLRTIAATAPTPAQDVYATIDFELQRAAQFALGDLTGAVVVLDLDTGEVLALASTPTFSPNIFSPFNRNAVAISSVLNDPRRPLLNHASQSTYPAGSVFKIVTMAAGLGSGLFTPDSRYTCTGEWDEINDPTFQARQDWLEGGHGEITFKEGLSGSCNTYFWHVGFALFNWDPRWLSDMARAFGLGQPTRIGQIDESPGLIPDPDWKRQTLGEAWSAIDAINLSIGQGDVLVTPLQMARLAAAVGNGGTLYQPQLVREVRPPDGAPTFTFQPIISGTLPLEPEHLAAIQEAMINVTREPLGTARNRFRNFPICVAGKTGTAEDPGLFGEQDPDAWFVGYTCEQRADRPDIAVAVVVQNQGQGSDFAAPIFRRVLESYYGLPLSRYPWEQAIGVPRPEETPTPEPGVEPATPSP